MLTVILEHPNDGILQAPVTGGTLDCRLDRYPRWQLRVDVRPALAQGVELWETPYGTRAHVLKPDGSVMFTGHVYEATANKGWTLAAADPILLFAQHKFSGKPGQFLPGTTMTVPAFIAAMATAIGITVPVTGSGGTVDVTALDLAGKDGWRPIEEQLIANALDVYPQPDGSLKVAPAAALKSTPDTSLRIGRDGTITAWEVVMRRVANRVVITHQAQKTGQADTYLDGTWQDNTWPAGVPHTGPVVHTETVRVGADWWDFPAAHQVQADANAAAAAQTVRGAAREASVDCIPDYSLAIGQTVSIEFTDASWDVFLICGLSWPLAGGDMTVSARNPDPGRVGTYIRTAPRRRHARINA